MRGQWDFFYMKGVTSMKLSVKIPISTYPHRMVLMTVDNAWNSFDKNKVRG